MNEFIISDHHDLEIMIMTMIKVEGGKTRSLGMPSLVLHVLKAKEVAIWLR